MLNIESAVQKVKAAREAMQEASKAAFVELFGDFLARYPQVKTVYWSQATPYWSDGDVCEFSVNDIYFSPASFEKIDGPYWGQQDHPDEGDGGDDTADFQYGRYSQSDNRVSDEMKIDMEAFASILMGDLADHLKDAFEDHSFVRVHRDGYVVEEYEHD